MCGGDSSVTHCNFRTIDMNYLCYLVEIYSRDVFLSRSNWIQFFFEYKNTHLYSCCWKPGLRIEEVYCSGRFLEAICFLVLMLATRMPFYSIMWLYQACNGKNKNTAVIYSPQCCSKQEFIVNTGCQAPKRSIYSKSSEAIWQFCKMNLFKIKVCIFGYIQLSDQM